MPLTPFDKSGTRIPYLDGFRGLAILLVVIGHLVGFSFGFWPRAGKMAEIGVLLFFVLSGFLITGLLVEESNRTGTISLAGFYRRRACRLLPALALFLIGVAILSWTKVLSDVPTRDFVAAIFYVRNIIGRGASLAHLWSLSLEEQFYILWPMLFLLFGAKRMPRVSVILVICVMLWRGMAIGLHLWDYNSGVFYERPWFRFDAIAVGCLLALIRLPSPPKWLFALSAAGLGLWSYYGEMISRPLFITLQTVLAAAVLYGVVQGDAVTQRLLSAGWLRWFGGISYSLYLWQQIFTVSASRMGWLREFPWNLLAAVGIAILSRELIEKPFLKLGRRDRESADLPSPVKEQETSESLVSAPLA
jgi:peptidoglycan/LPS O-acetylase OafA/YrhL